MQHQRFERIYLEKVALGEGCGCAEHVTLIREIQAIGLRTKAERAAPVPAKRLFAVLAGIVAGRSANLAQLGAQRSLTSLRSASAR